MYVPKHFEETRVETLHELIRSHPFGTLVTMTPNGLNANHIPFEIDPESSLFGTLRGHIARANPLWRDFSSEAEALTIFQGPSAYISPSWYPSKKEAGKAVPTWNYAIVHAYGPLRIIEDRNWLRNFVTQLTDRYEKDRAEPWKITDAPADYVAKLLEAIVGIEIPISRLIGKWKLTQNRSAADRQGVVDGLKAESNATATSVADLMRQLKG